MDKFEDQALEILADIQKLEKNIEVVFITQNPNLSLAVEYIKHGAFDVLSHPIEKEKLLTTVITAMHIREDGSNHDMTQTAIIDIQALIDYDYIDTLGSGDLGVVELVQRGEQTFALKKIKQLADNEKILEVIDEFLFVAKSTSELDNSNIAKVYDYGMSELGQLYILMEYVQGRDLGELMATKELHFPRKIDVIHQIARGLTAAHNHGVIHRGLKPTNILLTDNGLKVKLVDFGLNIINQALPISEICLSSLDYSSPEFFLSPESIDSRSDIFSLGSLSYELLTGHKPFKGETPEEIRDSILNEKPLAPSSLIPDFPKLIQIALAKMLTKNLDQRFQFTEEVAIILAELNSDLTNTTIIHNYDLNDDRNVWK